MVSFASSRSLKVVGDFDVEILIHLLHQPGAEFHADLPEPVRVLRKGTNPEVDLDYTLL